jgi:hypothetical protein
LFENAPQLFQNAPQKSISVPLCSKIGLKNQFPSHFVWIFLNLFENVRQLFENLPQKSIYFLLCSKIPRKNNLVRHVFKKAPQKQFSAPRVQKSATKTI